MSNELKTMYFVTSSSVFEVLYEESKENYLVTVSDADYYLPVPKENLCTNFHSAGVAKEMFFEMVGEHGVFVSGDATQLKLWQVQRELCDRELKSLRAQCSTLNAKLEGVRAYRSMLDKKISTMQNKKED